MRVTIVGLGGIGSHLADWIALYLSHLSGEHTLTLVDGDTFEERNRERQSFETPGNKAQSIGETLARKYAGLELQIVPEYLRPENADFILVEEEIVFLCVDNHKTRRIVSDVAGTCENITVISGGNELTDGNVQAYLRRDGRDVTPSLTDYHPEIEHPVDKAPFEKSCEELAKQGEPQIMFTNLMAAVLMANAFRQVTTGDLPYSEVFFDTILNAVRTRNFAPKTATSLDREPVTTATEVGS